MAGSPRKPMPSEAMVMPSWHAERYSSIASIWREHERRAALAFVAHLLDPALARAHEREFGRDEETVGCHEHSNAEQEEQLGHRQDQAALRGCYFEDRRRRSSADRARVASDHASAMILRELEVAR